MAYTTRDVNFDIRKYSNSVDGQYMTSANEFLISVLVSIFLVVSKLLLSWKFALNVVIFHFVCVPLSEDATWCFGRLLLK
jgi:hypothetical protein